VGIPVLVDGNAGGGNAINTIRLVRGFEKAGARGVCIEDNPFPKRCKLLRGHAGRPGGQRDLFRAARSCTAWRRGFWAGADGEPTA
jgi:2-methylisocitrate lyase-like PEP mutase family enzyme